MEYNVQETEQNNVISEITIVQKSKILTEFLKVSFLKIFFFYIINLSCNKIIPHVFIN